MMTICFSELPVGARFEFRGRRYEKLALSLARDEDRCGNVFLGPTEVVPDRGMGVPPMGRREVNSRGMGVLPMRQAQRVAIEQGQDAHATGLATAHAATHWTSRLSRAPGQEATAASQRRANSL